MNITQKRGRFVFIDETGKLRKFSSLDAAVEAGGGWEKDSIKVSGVHYSVMKQYVNFTADTANDDLGDD